jgi:hypothetical protein
VDGSHRQWAQVLDAHAYAVLARQLPASSLWSLMLDVMQQRASQRTAARVMEQWQSDRFVAPASIDQRTLLAVDGHLLAAAAQFEGIELSPLAPLGVCTTVGPTSQNKIVSTLRGTEVVSDPTNVLALECARRLRADPDRPVRLATSHRCVRAQPYPNEPGFAAHFRLFCLATAGREQKDHAFLVAALSEQINTMIRALDRLEQHGYAFPGRAVTVLATPERDAVADRIAAGLTGTPVARRPLEHAYYDRLRFQITIRTGQGQQTPLVDGGAFDWVGKLASNNRLVFVATGVGTQLIPFLCRDQSIQPPPTTTSRS